MDAISRTHPGCSSLNESLDGLGISGCNRGGGKKPQTFNFIYFLFDFRDFI